MYSQIKIDIISLFMNNEKIIDNYRKNIINLSNNKKYDCNFILIYNNSTDNTFIKLHELINDNVKIINTKSNGCSLAKNVGIYNARNDCNYLFFLDSDFIIDLSVIDDLINNITDDIKYISFYGGKLDNQKYIGGNFIMDDVIIKDINDKKYLGGGCSLISNDIIKKYNLSFDEFFDPFIMQDVDFSFKVLKYCKIKKIKMNKNIIHLGAYTIKKFSQDFYKNQLLRNSLYFMNKYNLINFRIFEDLKDFINLNFFHVIINHFRGYDLIDYPNNGKTLLLTKYDYLQFDNVDFHHDNINNLKSFIKNNNITTIIIDFIIYLENFNILQSIQNINIEIIIDVKDITKENYKKIFNVKKLYTFYNIYQFILKIIFNKMTISLVTYKTVNINKNNVAHDIILLYDQKYEKLYDFLESHNYKYKIVNYNELINDTGSYIYVDLNIDNKINNIINDKHMWMISPDNYPNREIVKDNINGNIIKCDYILNENHLLNDIKINIDEYISYISNNIIFYFEV